MTPKHLIDMLVKGLPDHLQVCITGEPGIGKTDIIKHVAKQLGYHLVVTHPAVADPTDYKGLPFVIKNQFTKDGKDVTSKTKKADIIERDEAHFLPFGDLQALIDATEPTIYFMDDLGQAPDAVQAGLMQLTGGKRINGHAVSEHIRFIAATNRRQDKANVSGMLEPVKSRFMSIIPLDVDVDNWIDWAIYEGNIRMEVITYVKLKRLEALHNFVPTKDLTNTPSPRTAEHVSNILKQEHSRVVEHELIKGAAGEGWATEFAGHLKFYRERIDPDAVLMNPGTAKIPEDPSLVYALTGALADLATEQNLGQICTYLDRLDEEYSVLCMTRAERVNPEIVNARAFAKWATQHGDVLVGNMAA